MRKLKKLLIIAGSGISLMSVMTVVGIKISSTAWFCLRCHETSNIAATWRKSKHSPVNSQGSACIHCHARPGFLGFLQSQVETAFTHLEFLDPTFPSFPSSLSARNCQANLVQPEPTAIQPTICEPVSCTQSGCHQIEDIDNHARPDRLITLNHVKHIQVMEKIGTISKCMPCHRDVAHGEGSFLPNMKSSCFLCHKERDIAAANCTLCHSQKSGVRSQKSEVRSQKSGVRIKAAP
ncbi:MAG: NapC/NirT family cytochrome c [bacterium]